MWCLSWHPGVGLDWKAMQHFAPSVKRKLSGLGAIARAAAQIIPYRFSSWEYVHVGNKEVFWHIWVQLVQLWFEQHLLGERERRGENLYLRDSVLLFLWGFGFLHCQESRKETTGNSTQSISMWISKTITQAKCLFFALNVLELYPGHKIANYY